MSPEQLTEIRNATASLRTAAAQLGPRTPENSMSAKHYAEVVTPDAVAGLLAHIAAREAQVKQALAGLMKPLYAGALGALADVANAGVAARNERIRTAAKELGIDL